MEDWKRLPGGAIQENFAVDVRLRGGPRDGHHRWVLRTDARSSVAVSLGRRQEFAVLGVAHAAGVAAPEPLWLCDDPAMLGGPFYLMTRLEGSADARRLVRSSLDAGARNRLLEALGANLARLHRIRPPHAALEMLGPAPERPVAARITEYRRHLDRMTRPQPVLEWGLAWLERHAPRTSDVVLCHCDYRTGNFMIDGDRLAGVLDWEFAAWSDPYEDLGWLCARCWRFGAFDREAGGIGPREPFYRGYSEHSGVVVDDERVRYFEVMATVRWAVIALQQAARFTDGGERTLELALTARVVPELEHDILSRAAP